MEQKKKRAFITGITGQDGSYLAELLLDKGYEVHGLVRRTSAFNRARIDHLLSDDPGKEPRVSLHYGDLTDAGSVHHLIRTLKPDEVYNLGAQSHVRVSFDVPESTGDIVALGTTRLLEAVRHECPEARVYQASSSEMFGGSADVPQKETTPLHPRSPYAAAKVYAYWMAVNYRESYGLHISNGILFNHESERRGENFVSRKITLGFAKLLAGTAKKLVLGNLYAKRDWGYAKDYVEGMWLMLQKDTPDDYVLATGESHSVKDFVEEAARLCDMELVWEGAGIEEKGRDKKTGNVCVEINPHYFRPAEVDHLIGDAGRAKKELGWYPKTSFQELVKIMLEHDCRALGAHKRLRP